MEQNGTGMRVCIPKIKDVRNAVIIFYENSQLDTKDIAAIFGCSSPKALELKKLARKAMLENGIMLANGRTVETETAFETWGLDIKSLEARMRKLEKLTGGAENAG